MGIHTNGTNAVDWEARVDMARLRGNRLDKLKAELEQSDLGRCSPLTSTTSVT